MNWKGDNAGKTAKHKWLYKHFGRPQICENKSCAGNSNFFEWCLKKGKEYSHERNDYLRLCRSCHRRYDMDEEKKRKAIKNLWWKHGKINPGKLNLQNLWWGKNKNKWIRKYHEGKND